MVPVAGELDQLREAVRRFRDERDWARFHNPKDLAISVALEAAELLELFQWKDAGEVDRLAKSDAGRARIEEEAADVLILLLSLADRCGFDLPAATERKLAANALKYPVERARGTARKYDEDVER